MCTNQQIRITGDADLFVERKVREVDDAHVHVAERRQSVDTRSFIRDLTTDDLA